VLQVARRDDDAAELAQAVIGRQVRHLSRLVDDLLDVSRVTSGKILLSRQPLDLGDAVKAVLDGWRAAGRLGRHEVVAELGPAWVDADPTRIEQIVSSLLSNAVKYTPASGRIRVHVGDEGGTAVLAITDTGIGIPPHLLQSVFALFVQAERPPDRSQGGLGIGLALVRALVGLHGGTVTAESAGRGLGSAFTVRMPTVAAPATSAPERVASALIGAPLRVVVVEDNADAREMLRIALKVAGHEVFEAADGPSGLERLLEVAPDVALIDIGLPLMDGYEVARRIRASERGQTMRLVAISGYGQAEDRQRALSAGFDTHVTKPVSRERLVEIVGSGDRAPTS
jgi:CheY-like chemotaxis protein